MTTLYLVLALFALVLVGFSIALVLKGRQAKAEERAKVGELARAKQKEILDELQSEEDGSPLDEFDRLEQLRDKRNS